MELVLKTDIKEQKPEVGDLLIFKDGRTRFVILDGYNYKLIDPSSMATTTIGEYDTIDQLVGGLSIKQIIKADKFEIIEK